MKRWSLYLIPLTLFVLTMALAAIPVLSVTPTAFISPYVNYASPGGSFTVDVKVVDVTASYTLYSFYINISFNPDVLQFRNLTEGDFLKEQPEGTIAWPPRVEQEDGWVYFGWSTKGAYEGVDGDGILAIVGFDVTSTGESPLNITNPSTELIEMRPIGGGHVPVQIDATFENGYFTNLAGVPPVASFDYSPEKPSIGEEITFNASASYDPDETGYIVSFEWDFGDGTIEVYVKDVNLTTTATHTYTTGGGKSVMLRVTDNSMMEDTLTRTVSVRFEHDVAVTNVQVAETVVTVGESVSIDVTVLNKGASTETFTVKATYDGNTVGEETVSNLAPDDEKTINFVWDTSGVAEGIYSLWANATGVADDGNLADNTKFGGSVEVKATAGFPTTYVIAAVALIIVVGIVIFALMRRRS